MKTVLLRGPLLTRSGYGVHARQVARWLFDKGEDVSVTCELLPWGVTPWITDVDACDGLVGQMLQSSVSSDKPKFYDISVQVQLPNEWNPFLAAFNVGITAGVETDTCNPDWVNCVNRMQLVIVPSEFTKQTFINSGKVTTSIVVVPEAFPDTMLAANLPATRTDKLGLTTAFNFLTVGQLTGNNPENDRKNLLYTVKWFSEVFPRRKDIGVIIKTSMFRQTHLDRVMVTNLFNKILSEVKADGGPQFYLLHGDMTDVEMAELYTNPAIKALVSLTHGEGFGLPLLEAAACGLPVIATNWSAHTEFLNQGKWLSVDYRLDAIHPTRVDNTIFFPQAKWAYPLEEHTKKRLTKFTESSSMPEQWARDLGAKLQETHRFSAISAKYDAVFAGKF